MEYNDIKLHCKRCGYSWISRIECPRQCPKCKSYEWNVYPDEPKLDPIIGKYYIKERTKFNERSFTVAHKNKIIKILGDKCEVCGKKGTIVHHKTYEGISKHHHNFKQYCKFLKMLCSECHGKEPRMDYHKELGLNIREYAKKIQEYEQVVYKRKYRKIKIVISVDGRIAKKIDEIKEYPMWNGNRSALLEYIVEEFLDNVSSLNKDFNGEVKNG